MTVVHRCTGAACGPRPHPAVRVSAWFTLGVLLVWLLNRVSPALSLPWWFNTDEVAFYYEVIRQLRLDFSQTFFDIPGTPYITIASLLTASWWLAERLLGFTTAATPSDFAFQNIQGVFALLRSLTLSLYALGVCLAFHLFVRCAGVVAALVAAVLFATLPIHVHYSHFARTESLGLVLSLGAIGVVVHSRWRAMPGAYGVAGVLAGIATGARFHFALVGLPVLLALLLFRNRDVADVALQRRGRRVVGGMAFAVALLLIAGGVITVAFQAGALPPTGVTDAMLLTTSAGPAQYASAKHTVASLWVCLSSASAALLVCQCVPRVRRWVRPVVNPFTVVLLLGWTTGFVVSHPTFLWRGEHQLRSIQFYSEWTDPALSAVHPVLSWWSVATYYFATGLPEHALQLAFVIGAVGIVWRGVPVHLALLVGACLAVVAHPVTMKRWPHHIIPWLPFLCFVAAMPIAAVVRRASRFVSRPLTHAAVVVAVGGLLVGLLSSRLDRADEYLKVSQQRTQQIADMHRWLNEHVPQDAYVLVSYFALNGEGFLKIIEDAGVRVPAFVDRKSNMHVWWLARSAVDGQAGYVCVSRADMSFFRDDFERRRPNSTYNPFDDDKRFERLATFGQGFYELQVFRFDARGASGT